MEFYAIFTPLKKGFKYMSTNISGIKRESLISKINQIKTFIEQNAHDQNAANLISYLGELTREVNGKKYGLVFEEHREAIDEKLENNAPVFTEEKGLFVDGGGELNFLLEGDNLASLKLLEKTHRGKIDVIYIDPPYNTGDEDFIYDDDFVDENDVFRHSKWLSFMDKRLKIAKNLLSDSGIIFISIDDNEQAPLKILCDEIFHESNFIDTLMVEMSNTGGMKVGSAKKGTITKNGEFVLIYAKNKSNQDTQRTPLFDFVPGFDTHFNLYRNEDGSILNFGDVLFNQKEIIEELNNFKIKLSKNTVSLKAISDIFDKSEVVQKYILENLDNICRPRNEVPNIPSDIKLETGKWKEYISEKREESYYLTKNEKNEIIQLVPMKYNYRNTDDFIDKYGRSVIRGDYWKGFWLDMGNIAKEGAVEFKNGKKPVRLIKQLLKWSISTNPSATILDFFAGSGTTGHAVLKLNAEDGGHRKFILCTNNENNICREITYQRLKTVITGKRKDGSKYSDGLPGSLKYFKTDFIPISEKMYYEYADDLLLHVRELVELENAVNFDKDKTVAIVLDDDEMEEFIATLVESGRNEQKDTSTGLSVRALYVGHDVLVSGKQEQILKAHNISVNTIPDYYYRDLAL